jgi:hypothetical protein
MRYRFMHEKRDKSFFNISINKKFQKYICFSFICILADDMVHENTQN